MRRVWGWSLQVGAVMSVDEQKQVKIFESPCCGFWLCFSLLLQVVFVTHCSWKSCDVNLENCRISKNMQGVQYPKKAENHHCVRVWLYIIMSLYDFLTLDSRIYLQTFSRQEDLSMAVLLKLVCIFSMIISWRNPEQMTCRVKSVFIKNRSVESERAYDPFRSYLIYECEPHEFSFCVCVYLLCPQARGGSPPTRSQLIGHQMADGNEREYKTQWWGWCDKVSFIFVAWDHKLASRACAV